MFAVIKTGGKQYRVSPQDIIRVERLSSPAGEVVELTDVLAMGREDGVKLGQPLVEGARVAATVLEHYRDDKIIVFRKQRRKNFRRTKGHRQHQTVLRIEEILAEGEKHTPVKAKKPAKKKATAKKTAAKKPTAKKAAAKKAPAKKAPAKSEAAKEKATETKAAKVADTGDKDSSSAEEKS